MSDERPPWEWTIPANPGRFTTFGPFHILKDLRSYGYTFASVIESCGGVTTPNIDEAHYILIDIESIDRDDPSRSLPRASYPVWIDEEWVPYRARTFDGHPIEDAVIDPYNLPPGRYPNYCQEPVYFGPSPRPPPQRKPEPSLFIPKRNRVTGMRGTRPPSPRTEAPRSTTAGMSPNNSLFPAYQPRPASATRAEVSRAPGQGRAPMRFGFDRPDTNSSPRASVQSSPSAPTTPTSSSRPALDHTAPLPGSPSHASYPLPTTPMKSATNISPARQTPRPSGQGVPPHAPSTSADAPAASANVPAVPSESVRPLAKRERTPETEAGDFRRKRRPAPRSWAEAAGRHIVSGSPPTSVCPWIRDVEFLERASRGLLRPLELIRLLPPAMIYELGIDIALWDRTPAVFPTADEQARRRQLFASAFATPETFDLVWDNYHELAALVRPESAPQLFRAFSTRMHHIRLIKVAIGWPNAVRLVHDQLEVTASHGADLSSGYWLDFTAAAVSYFVGRDDERSSSPPWESGVDADETGKEMP